MKKSICKNCGKEIGEWTDPWGWHPTWMHAPDDGPDAYYFCKDGDEPEPIETAVTA